MNNRPAKPNHSSTASFGVDGKESDFYSDRSEGSMHSLNNFSKISILPPSISPIQTKLKINEPGDKYEQEADEVAEQVMRMPAQTVQRKCAKCGDTEELGEMQLDRKKSGNSSEVASTNVPRVIKSQGQPLDVPTRLFMENRFGFDFSKVQIHNNSLAHQSAKDINALAYTHQHHIAFGAGQYQPQSKKGKELLAHELTHVVQQIGTKHTRPVSQFIQRQSPPTTPSPTVTQPQVTQQLYDQAIASIASKTGVNPVLTTILSKGKVNQIEQNVHSANTTLQVSIPAPTGGTGGATTRPAVTISFNLEISANTAQLAQGAFAQFVNDPANQTTFSGTTATGTDITRLLKIVTKAPAAGTANAADVLGEALVHEGTHMLLAIDELVSSLNVPGLSAGLTGAQVAFDQYINAATSSSLRNGLITSLVAEINRVFTPSGSTTPTISATDANTAAAEVMVLLLEERFAIDQQVIAYPRAVSNTTVVNAYLWDLLGDAASRKPWPQGSGAQALVANVVAFLDDVLAILNPPPTTSPTPAPTTPTPTPAPSPTPNNKNK